MAKIKLKIIGLSIFSGKIQTFKFFGNQNVFFSKIHNLTMFDPKLNFMEQKWILVPVCIKEEVKCTIQISLFLDICKSPK